MDNTVLSEFFKPANHALSKVRYSDLKFTSLSMPTFLLVGCLRHIQGTKTVREHIQQLFHITDTSKIPVARSTHSDALSSPYRHEITVKTVEKLVDYARTHLPDKLANIEELKARSVYAFDGSYQEESAHYGKRTPKDGGEDNPKGHMLFTFFDIKIGAPISVITETKNVHEMSVLKEHAKTENNIMNERNAILVADRAFIDMPFWDSQKNRRGQTVITRTKSNLVIESSSDVGFLSDKVNEGVVSDKQVKLKSSNAPWRVITYIDPDGNQLEFLTNELKLKPGLVAFLYLRRWDVEKCFDVWKNDFVCKKAWSKSHTGISMQAWLAIMTTLLLLIFVKKQQDNLGVDNEKCYRKQSKKNSRMNRKTWYYQVFHALSRVCRQSIRFLKECFRRKATQELYEAQLRPLFLRYI